MSVRAAVRCLGEFSLRTDGVAVARWRAGKARNLFQYLLVNRGRLVQRDKLYDVLWPDTPWTPGSSSLKVAVHALRQVIRSADDAAAPALEITQVDGGYRLEAGEMWADFEEFEQACALAARAENAGDDALRHWRRAAELYNGDFLPGETSDWVAEYREWIRVKALRALNALCTDAQRRGETTETIELCRRMLQIDPYQESIYQTLMTMHSRLGELGQVRNWHDLCVRRLRDELAVEPHQDTTRILARAVGRVPATAR